MDDRIIKAPTHSDLYKSIGRLEGKVDILLAASAVRDGRYDIHDERLRNLERDRNIRIGERGVVAAILLWIGWPKISALAAGIF